MAETILSGPVIAHGNMLGVAGASLPDYNQVAGPSLFFQGSGFPDPRFTPLNKDNIQPGSVPAFYNGNEVTLVDAQPQALGSAVLAASQAVAGAGAATLITTSSSKQVCGNVPIVPKGSTTPVTVWALDLGFQTVNVNGTATVTIAAGTANRFPVGLWIWIAGTSGAAGTFTQVTANAGLSTTTSITISPAVSNTAASAPVATTNLLSPYMPASSQPAPTGVYPWYTAGGSSAAAMFDPTQAITRAVSITSSSAGDTTQTAIVRGYDIYLNPMAETIAFNGAATISGKKAFKYVASITISAALAGNFTAGTLDIIGMNLRMDLFENLRIFMNGAGITASTGWLTADKATATATTGDVRGTYNVQSASDGTKRLIIYGTPSVQNMLAARVADPAPLFGVTQFTV